MIEQGTILDRIDQHTSHARDMTSDAVKELTIARDSQGQGEHLSHDAENGLGTLGAGNINFGTEFQCPHEWQIDVVNLGNSKS